MITIDLLEYLTFERFFLMVGFICVILQYRQANKISMSEFEDGLDQQYRALTLPIPVPVLLGQEVHGSEYEIVRELIYNYLDLSNEQCFLYSRGKISKKTWKAWRAGIQDHLSKPTFAKVLSEIKSQNPNTFTYLNEEHFKIGTHDDW